MQFIEKNSLNVRSAVYRLKKDGTGLEFLIFPMIHVGSREFYEEVSRRLSTCDLILAEGVKSKRANILTLSYRIVRKIRRMDLITQHEGKLNDERSEKAQGIGIVYGALHMRDAMAFLMQNLNYRVAKAEWVKVFDL